MPLLYSDFAEPDLWPKTFLEVRPYMDDDQQKGLQVAVHVFAQAPYVEGDEGKAVLCDQDFSIRVGLSGSHYNDVDKESLPIDLANFQTALAQDGAEVIAGVNHKVTSEINSDLTLTIGRLAGNSDILMTKDNKESVMRTEDEVPYKTGVSDPPTYVTLLAPKHGGKYPNAYTALEKVYETTQQYADKALLTAMKAFGVERLQDFPLADQLDWGNDGYGEDGKVKTKTKTKTPRPSGNPGNQGR